MRLPARLLNSGVTTHCAFVWAVLVRYAYGTITARNNSTTPIIIFIAMLFSQHPHTIVTTQEGSANVSAREAHSHRRGAGKQTALGSWHDGEGGDKPAPLRETSSPKYLSLKGPS